MHMEFYISPKDGERLFAVKKLQGKDDLTGNDFAAELLHRELVRLFPAEPDFDESGNILNADRYTGDSPRGLASSLLQRITAAYNAEVDSNARRGELDHIPHTMTQGEMLEIILTKYALQNFPGILGKGVKQ